MYVCVCVCVCVCVYMWNCSQTDQHAIDEDLRVFTDNQEWGPLQHNGQKVREYLTDVVDRQWKIENGIAVPK